MSIDRCQVQSNEKEKYYSKVKDMIENNVSGGRYKKEYWKSNRKDKMIHDLTIVEGTFIGAAAGGVVGGACGGICGIPGGPLGIGIGIGAGTAGGMIIGGGIGTAIGVAIARHQSLPKYKQWCETQKIKSFTHNLNVLLNPDEISSHVICPLSQLPVINAVRTPQGQIYEKYELMKWLKKNGTDPLTREPLSEVQLKKDSLDFENGPKKLYQLLKEKVSVAEKYAPEQVQGMKDLMEDIVEAAYSFHRDKMFNLADKLREGKITLKEYEAKQAKYNQIYFNL
ncbi:MAG: hypothetical protein KDK55_02360 [Chlamydiia bacterium]|nr:hypothetical protein [Chlamydiia bacterium]